MFFKSKVYQTLLNLAYVKLYRAFDFANQFNVANLDYIPIPAWAKLGPAQPQLVVVGVVVNNVVVFFILFVAVHIRFSYGK